MVGVTVGVSLGRVVDIMGQWCYTIGVGASYYQNFYIGLCSFITLHIKTGFQNTHQLQTQTQKIPTSLKLKQPLPKYPPLPTLKTTPNDIRQLEPCYTILNG